MVKLKLCWSREHCCDFLEALRKRLEKDSSGYFDINFYLDGCNISIDQGEIKQ